STSYFEFTDVVRAFISPRHGLNIQALIGHSFGAAAVINALDKEKLPLKAVCISPILRLRELLERTFERFGVNAKIQKAVIADLQIRFGYNLAKDNPPRLIGGLNAPLLIIHDDHDRIASYNDVRQQVGRHPHIALHTTSGLGHRRILSDENVIQAALAHIGRSGNPNRVPEKKRNHMNQQNAIIDQYQSADDEQRLGLYLIHRELRDAFIEIDLAGPTAALAHKPAGTDKCRRRKYRCFPGELKHSRT
ncbi:MAG: hypothetical protein HKP58_20685, partial [Desulfatitalea sp.]|nr:lysophospholipase [Desulfatitalea sp.]NNK02836.1 hypothetical protein [Desulfatitalea sp.]